LPAQERADSLVDVLTNEERIAQLIIDGPAIARAGVPAYMWRNNVLHGLVDNGISTQFPQATGLAATWNTQMMRQVGKICGTEQRAKHNLKVEFDSIKNDSPMNYGLDLWGPNINMLRDSRWGRGQETYGECPTLTGTLLHHTVLHHNFILHFHTVLHH
jgi:beta-glucosidase